MERDYDANFVVFDTVAFKAFNYNLRNYNHLIFIDGCECMANTEMRMIRPEDKSGCENALRGNRRGKFRVTPRVSGNFLKWKMPGLSQRGWISITARKPRRKTWDHKRAGL